MDVVPGGLADGKEVRNERTPLIIPVPREHHVSTT